MCLCKVLVLTLFLYLTRTTTTKPREGRPNPTRHHCLLYPCSLNTLKIYVTSFKSPNHTGLKLHPILFSSRECRPVFTQLVQPSSPTGLLRWVFRFTPRTQVRLFCQRRKSLVSSGLPHGSEPGLPLSFSLSKRDSYSKSRLPLSLVGLFPLKRTRFRLWVP